MNAQAYGGLDFAHRFAALPSLFYTAMSPEGVARTPELVAHNPAIAEMIGLNPACFDDPDFPAIFSGNSRLPGGHPLAMAYSGHQFGVWAGQLGDGRAILIGQSRAPNGKLWDIQLKGSGLTPYSRMGDGRAVLRSCVREYLAGIALHGLDVPTSHALCLVTTGSPVQRERIEPGCVLTRIADSHIRFGHFEHLAHHGMSEQLPILLNHIIAEYCPGLSYPAYLETLIHRTAMLIADWQAIGFAHGVMNTDNMSALGITIDYGPYGFLDHFDLGFICNHSDHQGRYRFDRQPEVAHWNLLALCSALQSVIPFAESREMLHEFLPLMMQHYHERMMTKLGLPAKADGHTLWQELLMLLQDSSADYTLSFRSLADWLREPTTPLPFATAEKAESWLVNYRALILRNTSAEQAADIMDSTNPRYILRNWVAESVIRALEDHNDPVPLQRLSEVLTMPYDSHPDCIAWRAPPTAGYAGLAISCSS